MDVIILAVVGVAAIAIGTKAFTPTGIPLTRKTNVTGGRAVAIGIVCFALGGLLILFAAALALFLVVSIAGSAGR